jgi:DNA-binding response OmpR family regulator
MTARILVVDDIPANLKLLEARFLAEYFEVLTAASGYEALAICERNQVDLILLDIMMPGLDGFEVCERLKANAKTAHIPVIMVTALDQSADRVRSLKAGADDFLTKPVNDLQLISRVKSLLRLAGSQTRSQVVRNATSSANVLVVDARANSQERIIKTLKPIADVTAISDPQAALFEAAENLFDLVVVNANFNDYDPLRLCSQFRSLERTRFLPILLIVEQGDDNMVIRALDLGINDYIVRPVDPSELVARCDNLLNKRNRRLHTPSAAEGDARPHGHTKPPLGPVLFDFIDGRLATVPSPGTVSAPDRANAAAALEVLINDARRLDEALVQSNADYRLIEIFRTLSTLTSSGENVIKLGLVNIECLQMAESFDRAGELSAPLVGAFRAQYLKTHMYVSQFEEWNRFSANATETSIDDSDIPSLTDTVDNLAAELSRQTNDVDTNVPKSLEFLLGLVHEPRRTSKKAIYALMSVIEGMALSVARYCSDILEGSAKSAAGHIKKAFGVAAAAIVLKAAISYFDIAVKAGSTPWLSPAIEIIKKYIEAFR